MKKAPTSSLRIIGGEWRSRKLSFLPANPQLRPTPDRVRETLFNWLQNDVHGAHCLDLFAGSGALGLEALSRGASQCVFVETHTPTLQQLKHNLTLLNSTNANIVSQDALKFLQQTTTTFDLVFLDPPFDLDLWSPALTLLQQRQLLSDQAKVYLETPSKRPSLSLDNTGWKLLREKISGDVRYQLITPQFHQDSN